MYMYVCVVHVCCLCCDVPVCVYACCMCLCLTQCCTYIFGQNISRNEKSITRNLGQLKLHLRTVNYEWALHYMQAEGSNVCICYIPIQVSTDTFWKMFGCHSGLYVSIMLSCIKTYTFLHFRLYILCSNTSFGIKLWNSFTPVVKGLRIKPSWI